MTSEPRVSEEDINLDAVRPAAEEDEKVEVGRLQLRVCHQVYREGNRAQLPLCMCGSVSSMRVIVIDETSFF